MYISTTHSIDKYKAINTVKYSKINTVKYWYILDGINSRNNTLFLDENLIKLSFLFA